MSKGTLVFLLGILLVVVPYFGIPAIWKQYIFVAIGSLLLVLGYMLRRAQYLADIDTGDGHRTEETFVETTQNLFP